jgi:hypothetical protein
VPASFANRPVSVRLYADRIVVCAEGQVIAEHDRIIERSHGSGGTVYDWRHYLSVLQRKTRALRNRAPFATLREGFKRLQAVLLRRPGGDREMVERLALVLHHDEQAVLTAAELALESGAPSKQHVPTAPCSPVFRTNTRSSIRHVTSGDSSTRSPRAAVANLWRRLQQSLHNSAII